jgi:hypothetical protein
MQYLVDSGPHTVEKDSRQDLAGNGQQHNITLVVRLPYIPYIGRFVRVTAKCPYIPQIAVVHIFRLKNHNICKMYQKNLKIFKILPSVLILLIHLHRSTILGLITLYFCKILQISCDFSFKHCFKSIKLRKKMMKRCDINKINIIPLLMFVSEKYLGFLFFSNVVY